MLLDSPEGLALRYQYLGIETSSAEQAAFFARFGDVLRSVFEQRFDEIDRKLARIEFHSECLRPTRSVALGVRLKRALRSDEIGNLLMLAVVVAEKKPEPHPTLCLAMAAGPDRVMPGGSAFQCEVTIWVGSPPKRLLSGSQAEGFPERDRFSFGLPIEAIPGFACVADFDSLWLHLYVNRGAIDLVSAVELRVNGYVLARSDLKDLSFDPAGTDDEWVRHCLDEHQRAQILESVDGPTSGVLLPPFVFTDFAAYLPMRADE